MALVVVSYPNISEDDYAWIQAARAGHDALTYHAIEPHVTFVFPSAVSDEAAFVEHVRRQAAGVPRIRFVSRCAAAVHDGGGEHSHVFLVVDEGNSWIVRLHDRLYTGLLAAELRLDIPFIPHIGVGNSLDIGVCKALADELNRREFAVEGTIDVLDVAAYDGGEVRTVARVELA